MSSLSWRKQQAYAGYLTNGFRLGDRAVSSSYFTIQSAYEHENYQDQTFAVSLTYTVEDANYKMSTAGAAVYLKSPTEGMPTTGANSGPGWYLRNDLESVLWVIIDKTTGNRITTYPWSQDDPVIVTVTDSQQHIAHFPIATLPAPAGYPYGFSEWYAGGQASNTLMTYSPSSGDTGDAFVVPQVFRNPKKIKSWGVQYVVSQPVGNSSMFGALYATNGLLTEFTKVADLPAIPNTAGTGYKGATINPSIFVQPGYYIIALGFTALSSAQITAAWDYRGGNAPMLFGHELDASSNQDPYAFVAYWNSSTGVMNGSGEFVDFIDTASTPLSVTNGRTAGSQPVPKIYFEFD